MPHAYCALWSNSCESEGKVRGALQQRMKQQHEREWGNTHASLSAAAAAAAEAVVWGWAAISRLLIPTSCYTTLSSAAQVSF